VIYNLYVSSSVDHAVWDHFLLSAHSWKDCCY